jgi:hypothetical protein
MKRMFLAAVIICSSIICEAQAPPDSNVAVYQQLSMLQQFYASLPQVNFTMSFSVADSLHPSTILDSGSMRYQVSGARMFIADSSSEMLRTDELSVFVDKTDSTVLVSRNAQENTALQIPLLDSAFREDHIAGITSIYIDSTSAIKDPRYKVRISFKPDSPYLSYEILYNANSFFIESINIKERDNYGRYEDLPVGHIASTTYTFRNYSNTLPDPALYNYNRYVYLLNGQFYLQSTWEHFQLQTP